MKCHLCGLPLHQTQVETHTCDLRPNTNLNAVDDVSPQKSTSSYRPTSVNLSRGPAFPDAVLEMEMDDYKKGVVERAKKEIAKEKEASAADLF